MSHILTYHFHHFHLNQVNLKFRYHNILMRYHLLLETLQYLNSILRYFAY